MSILPILRWPDPRLTTRCEPVGGADVAQLAADMLETMYAAPGRGLAGPQVGAMLRLFVMDTGWKEGVPTPLVCIDPEILWMSDERATGTEGCLSIPGITTEVSRAKSIRLRWRDLTGAVQERDMTGFDAICAQHEYDHLDGLVTFDRLSPEERARAIAAYAA